MHFPQVIHLHGSHILKQAIFGPAMCKNNRLERKYMVSKLCYFSFIGQIQANRIKFLPRIGSLKFRQQQIDLFLIRMIMQVQRPPRTCEVPCDGGSDAIGNVLKICAREMHYIYNIRCGQLLVKTRISITNIYLFI